MRDNSILCYCAAVKKQLQVETLTQALEHLIRYQEMLQVRLEGGKYVPEPEAPEGKRNKLLSIYSCAGKSTEEIETLIKQIIDSLAGEMRCERGESIRAALLNIEEGPDKLFLLAHREIVDQRGLVLIFEDLYRIYEQLSAGKRVGLRRVRKSYPAFIKEVLEAKKPETNDLLLGGPFKPDLNDVCFSNSNIREEAVQREVATFTITLDKPLKRHLFSWRFAAFELAPVEALTGALLRSLARAGAGDSVSINIKTDYRFADEMLNSTVGVMTQTRRLQSDFAEEYELFSNIKKFRGILRHILLRCSPQFLKGPIADNQMCLNLEYLTDEPWLGGDEWLPEGFIPTGKGRLREGYSLEITPFILSDRIEIFIEYQGAPELKALVETFAANLVPELEAILRYCEGYVDAKEFWVREFAKATAQAKIEIESDGRPGAEAGRASIVCGVEKSVIDRALLSVEADESQLLLAAYSVLASRLNGREDLAFLCTLDQDGVSTVFPLRLNPLWTSSFMLFVNQVKDKLRQAASFGPYALDILSEEQPKHGRPYPVSDLGYVFKKRSVEKIEWRPAVGSPAGNSSFNQVPDLALEISQCNGDLDIRFVYETNRFSAEIIKRLSGYLNAILQDVAADAHIKLGDVEFERDRKVYETASTLAGDAFNF